MTNKTLIAALALAMPLAAQNPSAAERRILVRAGRLIDVASDGAKADQGILITGDRITRVGPYADIVASAGNAERVDLSRLTVIRDWNFSQAWLHSAVTGEIINEK